MELNQRLELRKLLAPQLQQSLNILTLHLLDLNQIITEELHSNPVLEESSPKEPLSKNESLNIDPDTKQDIHPLPAGYDEFSDPPVYNASAKKASKYDFDFTNSLIANKTSLLDVLYRQLGIFTNTDEDLKIGQEIIGNINENGYLRVPLEEISSKLQVSTEKVEKVLKLIQHFEPAGVGARTISECLLIQLDLLNENDPLLRKIVEFHLTDVAKKNYSRITKALKLPLEKIKPLIDQILKLNPKPGRNYSTEITYRIIPDIIIEEKKDDLEITINNEYTPTLSINKTYKEMLKKDNLDPKTREFLTEKLRRAMELIKALSKRQSTLRRVVEAIVEIQEEAIKEDLSKIKPLTFRQIAAKLNLHESTICRVIMNKYVKTPCGTIALKNFFSRHINDMNGQSVSSVQIKTIVKELIDQEDKRHPLSDQDIIKIFLQDHKLEIARRTIAKYRQELKILPSSYRRER